MFQKTIVQRWNELNPQITESVETPPLQPRGRRKFSKLAAIWVGGLVFVGFGSVWFVGEFENEAKPSPAISGKAVSGNQLLRKVVLDLDKARNDAIRFRDVGLISEYADQFSPIFGFDRRLIETMIEQGIVIRGVKYSLLDVEQISLRRSGTSEFMRLFVRDTRSGYEQTIQGKSSMIPARVAESWELEMYRQLGETKWTLWSAIKTRELRP